MSQRMIKIEIKIMAKFLALKIFKLLIILLVLAISELTLIIMYEPHSTTI